MLIMYLVQFLLLPVAFPIYFPRSNEATAMLALPLLALCAAGVLWITDTFWHWLTADMLYLLLIAIYPAEGAYGFGLFGASLDGAQAMYQRDDLWIGLGIVGVLLLLVQLVLWSISKLIKHVKRR